MRTLICGSIAYDTIMVFHDRFKHHILPEQIHILNVAFLVPDMRREFGGTAGNIAYNLKLLGGEPIVMATVGDDCAPYVERLRTLGIADAHVRQVPQTFTAQAFITTDLDDNQITAFHPGAMNHSHMNKVSDAGDIRLAIVAPDGRDGMFQHAAQLRDAGIPFIFDPGQGMPMFGAEDLLHFMDLADYCTVNDYEARLMAQKTGRSIEELARMVRALVVTLGAEGSEIHVDGRIIRIPSAAPEAEVDPTGCGDAFRAGLIHGINHGLDWEQTGRLASLMGAIKIAHRGGQNHKPTRDEIGARYHASFGSSIW
ncbi:MAG TPA: carbohydrate kinase family protein [Rhodocyclaceae bacterium]|nr:carbohydrate kinase family protein [Rhodocyclaceae bacterium]HMV52902.1 carbohydrate kinase family protein [Rhodocyclaceae bacterium]HNA04708.1 carbohydrate kinase family protein [Rhodocyclaceae bacterium]HNB79631.1 carbohydrate kinase family protein [Rhodocyclaceae bacterium]HNC62016.1 carbohydrate kinase family protein [Rhodocyclaceae bacterium]